MCNKYQMLKPQPGLDVSYGNGKLCKYLTWDLFFTESAAWASKLLFADSARERRRRDRKGRTEGWRGALQLIKTENPIGACTVWSILSCRSFSLQGSVSHEAHFFMCHSFCHFFCGSAFALAPSLIKRWMQSVGWKLIRTMLARWIYLLFWSLTWTSLF